MQTNQNMQPMPGGGRAGGTNAGGWASGRILERVKFGTSPQASTQITDVLLSQVDFDGTYKVWVTHFF